MPVDPFKIRTLKAEIICKKYRKPEKVGSLYLPEQSLEDNTGQIWEVVRSNDKADQVLGHRLEEGDIITIRWGHATDLGVNDEADDRRLYLIKAEDVKLTRKKTWR